MFLCCFFCERGFSGLVPGIDFFVRGTGKMTGRMLLNLNLRLADLFFMRMMLC